MSAVERRAFEERAARTAEAYGVRPSCPDCKHWQEGDFHCPDHYCRNSPNGCALETLVGAEADSDGKVFRLLYERARFTYERTRFELLLPRGARNQRSVHVSYLWRRALPTELSPMQRLTVLLYERQSRARILTPELEALGHVRDP